MDDTGIRVEISVLKRFYPFQYVYAHRYDDVSMVYIVQCTLE